MAQGPEIGVCIFFGWGCVEEGAGKRESGKGTRLEMRKWQGCRAFIGGVFVSVLQGATKRECSISYMEDNLSATTLLLMTFRVLAYLRHRYR